MKNKLALFALAALILSSCGNPISDYSQAQMVEVTFGVSSSTPVSASQNSRAVVVPGTPDSILLSIDWAAGGSFVADKVLKLYSINGGLVSEPLSMPVDAYRLTKFIVLDSNAIGIYLTPLTGSSKALTVQDSLPIDFNVSVQGNTAVTPEVIPVAGSTPGAFGYTGLDFNVVSSFDVRVQVKVPGGTGFVDTSSYIQVKNGTEELYGASLVPGLNRFTLNDLPVNYTLTVVKPGYLTDTAVYDNAQMKNFLNNPLLITLQAASYGSLTLWNKFESSVGSVIPSAFGPDGTIDGSLTFGPAQHGQGIRTLSFVSHSAGDGSYAAQQRGSFPKSVIPGGKGTIEFWIVPAYNTPVGVQRAWTFINSDAITFDWIGQYSTINNRMRFILAKGGQSTFCEIQNPPTLTAGVPAHYALVWDRNGIDGGPNTMRIYLNGAIIGSSNAAVARDTNSSDTTPLKIINMVNDGWGGDWYLQATMDNLKIWNGAKTDFLDRFVE